MDHIVVHEGARSVVRIGEHGSAVRSSGFWINIVGTHSTSQEVLAAYDQFSRAVEEMFESMLEENDGPVDPEILLQVDEALADAVDRHRD